MVQFAYLADGASRLIPLGSKPVNWHRDRLPREMVQIRLPRRCVTPDTLVSKPVSWHRDQLPRKMVAVHLPRRWCVMSPPVPKTRKLRRGLTPCGGLCTPAGGDDPVEEGEGGQGPQMVLVAARDMGEPRDARLVSSVCYPSS
jgi:hypothetical protein